MLKKLVFDIGDKEVEFTNKEAWDLYVELNKFYMAAPTPIPQTPHGPLWWDFPALTPYCASTTENTNG